MDGDARESLDQRLYNMIGFIRAMRVMAARGGKKEIPVDTEILDAMLHLLNECKEKLEAEG